MKDLPGPQFYLALQPRTQTRYVFTLCRAKLHMEQKFIITYVQEFETGRLFSTGGDCS